MTAVEASALLVVEDHPLVTESVAALGKRAGIARAEVATTVAEAQVLLERAQLDRMVAVVDIQLGDGSGLDLLRRWAPQGLRALVLTGEVTDQAIRDSLAAGALGFVAKTEGPQILLRAIEAVSHGDSYLSEAAKRVMSSAVPGVALTPRETDVLGLVGRGLTNKEIAQQLGVAVRTAESHRERLMNKLGAHNAADLTREAVKRGLVKAG